MYFTQVITVITLFFVFQTLVTAGTGDYSGQTSPSNKFKSCSTKANFKPSEFLDLHNKARKSVNAATISWDQGLSNVAQCWANRCQFEHSHTQGMGENIAAGSGPYTDQNAIVDWWEEFKLYRKGMDFTEQTGHYTQVAWKATRKIGCGVALCPAAQLGLGGTFKQARFVVCEYFPPGNVIGSFRGQVNLPKKDPLAHMGDKYGQDDYSEKGNDDYTGSESGSVNDTISNDGDGSEKPKSGNNSDKTEQTTPAEESTSTVENNTPSTSPNNDVNASSAGSSNPDECDQGDDYGNPNAGDNCNQKQQKQPVKPIRKHKHSFHKHQKQRKKSNSGPLTGPGGTLFRPASQPITPSNDKANDSSQDNEDCKDDEQRTPSQNKNQSSQPDDEHAGDDYNQSGFESPQANNFGEDEKSDHFSLNLGGLDLL